MKTDNFFKQKVSPGNKSSFTKLYRWRISKRVKRGWKKGLKRRPHTSPICSKERWEKAFWNRMLKCGKLVRCTLVLHNNEWLRNIYFWFWETRQTLLLDVCFFPCAMFAYCTVNVCNLDRTFNLEHIKYWVLNLPSTSYDCKLD